MGKVPEFKSAEEEAEFWETHSPLDFADQFEEIKESIIDRRGRKKGIYIRVDPEVITAARSIGAHLGIGYQTLFRIWIMEGLSGQHLTQTGVEANPAGPFSFLAEALPWLPPESQQRLIRLLRRAVESEIGDVQARYGAWPSSYGGLFAAAADSPRPSDSSVPGEMGRAPN